MKKIILLSMCLGSVMFLLAQPALTYVRPPYGTTKTYGMYAGSMTEPSIGENQNWDYSSYSPSSIGTGIYTDPATLPESAKSKFPAANYVEVWQMPTTLDKTVIDYYYDCSDSLVKLGQQSSGGNNFSTWGYVQGVWNMAYGDSRNARFMDPMTGTLKSTPFTYAAYGTLKTFHGTYDNVVMLSFEGNKNFFQTTPYFGLLMNIVYSSPTTIAGAYINNFGTSSGVNDLSVSKSVAVTSLLNSNQIQIDLFDYKGSCNVNVYDVIGQKVYQTVLNYNAQRQTISIENVSTGLYLVELNYNSAINSTKVFLTK